MLVSQFQEIKENDPTMASTILVATCDLVWAAVNPHGPNYARFLVGGGPEAILDVMEAGHSCHQPVLLSLLSDLLQNPRAHKFVHEWKSTATGRSAAELFIEIWREQEDAKGISDKGVLVNTARPITGEGKRKKWIAEDSFVYGMLHEDRRKEVDLLQSMMDPDKMMTKLYGIIKLMGFETFHYLNARDKATMALIEKYLKFRQGEVWQDISGSFEEAGMKPTAPDRERLLSGIESAEHIAQEVQTSQKDLILHHQEKLHVEESLFYTNMLLQKKADAEARFFQKDRSQLTMKERLEAKLKKEEMLRNSIRAAQSEYCNAEYSRQTSSDVEC
ncbi:hypothetical protein BSKO_04167 [Bryopsis sp. KO-2023]|nr:hypothetical protein BSKO_04167 [Bryopsis sp. KO-2023]